MADTIHRQTEPGIHRAPKQRWRCGRSFLGVEERIRKDKKHPGVSIEISKGDAVYDLLLLCRTGVIGMSDLEEFSDSTKNAVRQLLDLR